MPRRLKEKTWLEILNEAKSKRRTTIGGIPGWKADFSYFNKNQKPLFGVRFFIEYTNSEKIRTTFYFPAGTTMKAARQLALEARSKIESGIDIQKVRLEEKKSLRIVASTEDTTTKQSYLFENVFEEWVVFSKKNGKWRFKPEDWETNISCQSWDNFIFRRFNLLIWPISSTRFTSIIPLPVKTFIRSSDPSSGLLWPHTALA